MCGHGRKLTQILHPFYFPFVFPQEASVSSHEFLSAILRLSSVRKNASIKDQVSPELAIYHKCPIFLLFQ